ncbi:DUF3267 domain-containing protein [Mycoplasmatota bacterium]|nr:DUF3267 domain-containing protein [Mycoplasmatota bacterium]
MENLENRENIRFVKINGYYTSIIVLVILFILSGIIYGVKIKWMNEALPLNDLPKLIKRLDLYFIILLVGIFVHEFIKFVIYKIYGVGSIKLKFKQLLAFLYSPNELTILQARLLWIIPFLFIAALTIISIIYFNFSVVFGFSILLITISDDLVMYLNLLKFNRNDVFIQEENFLGFKCIQRNE